MHKTQWSGGNHELGRAIEAATTTYRDNGQPPGSSRGYKSALIASWAVHFWSDQQVQRALPDTRQSAARVFAAYMGDVNRISPRAPDYLGVNPLPDADSILPGKQAYGAVFGHEESKRAMTWAFKDPEALKTVVAAHGEYSLMAMDARGAQIAQANRDAFNAWHKSHPNADKAEVEAQKQKILRDNMAGQTAEDFKSTVYNLSKSLHFIVDAGNQSDVNAADARDKTNEIMKDVAISTGKLMLTPAGDWVAAGYEFLDENLGDQIKFEEGTKAREKAETALDTSENLFKDMTADAMMRNGLFGEDTASATTHPHASENYAKASERDFLRDGEILPRSAMKTPQQIAYEHWLEHGPASGLFKDVSDAVRDDSIRANPPILRRTNEGTSMDTPLDRRDCFGNGLLASPSPEDRSPLGAVTASPGECGILSQQAITRATGLTEFSTSGTKSPTRFKYCVVSKPADTKEPVRLEIELHPDLAFSLDGLERRKVADKGAALPAGAGPGYSAIIRGEAGSHGGPSRPRRRHTAPNCSPSRSIKAHRAAITRRTSSSSPDNSAPSFCLLSLDT